MQSHHGLHGIGNNNTNSHQAQFVRLRFPFFSDSIQFTSLYLQLIPDICELLLPRKEEPCRQNAVPFEIACTKRNAISVARTWRERSPGQMETILTVRDRANGHRKADHAHIMKTLRI
jgi:hypothetical protein